MVASLRMEKLLQAISQREGIPVSDLRLLRRLDNGEHEIIDAHQTLESLHLNNEDELECVPYPYLLPQPQHEVHTEDHVHVGVRDYTHHEVSIWRARDKSHFVRARIMCVCVYCPEKGSCWIPEHKRES
jgi:hypothetical protein